MTKVHYEYDEDNKKLDLIGMNESLELCSEPIQIKNHIYFIHPFEWECKGDLIKFNLLSGKFEKELIYDDKDYTIKDILIIEEDIFLIIGYVWGTVNSGGNLFKCDLNFENLKLLKEFDNKIQINRLTLDSKNRLVLSGIEYIDDNYDEYNTIEFVY